MAFLITLHTLAAVLWVGGMFFAYVVLRPAAASLEPEARLTLWHGVFKRFFPWVWLSIVTLLASGYGMVFLVFGGFAGVGGSVHLMQLMSIVMMLLFLHLFFAPWRRFRRAVKDKRFPDAAKSLTQIRFIVAINLGLGLLTIVVGASGRFW